MARTIKSNKRTKASDIVELTDERDSVHASNLQTESETHLEDDRGEGGAAIIRQFEFAANPEAFHQHKPTHQELFNHHKKGIEIMLWRDGLEPLPEVTPRININKKGTKYRIIVGAKPQRGHTLYEPTQTLTQIVHGNTKQPN